MAYPGDRRRPHGECGSSLGMVKVHMAIDAAAVGTLTLFQGLPEEHLAQVTAKLHSRLVPAGTNLITAEQPGEAVYLLVRGTAKVHNVDRDGREVILAILGPDEVVGEMSLLDDLGRSANVRTMEECEVLWMDRQTFQRSLHAVPGLAVNLLRILSRRLRMADARVQALAAFDVEGRVAAQLLAFADQYGTEGPGSAVTIPLRLTQSDLAELVGASRARVNHAMSSHQRHGYVSVDARYHITIHDRAPLARLCLR